MCRPGDTTISDSSLLCRHVPTLVISGRLSSGSEGVGGVSGVDSGDCEVGDQNGFLLMYTVY